MPDWDPEANDLFLRAIELPAEDRPRFLDEACAENATLRARVDALLRAAEEAGSFLEEPLVYAGGTAGHEPFATEVAPPGVGLGTSVGPYVLVQKIGEGGMGTVYLAQQTEPVRRLVAVKLIKPGMDSRQVLARFEAERQALAVMDHPGIAKVLDAGATPDGRPYFVMELVKGTPITEFCDDRRFGVRDRLVLFVDVCRAVQHAHQKGIIHRDLKPGNVLVAPYDGKPVVKVIDFGVAKAAGQPLTDRTLVTGLGAVVGTPEYMSPEQAELNNQDIDTRSDVYALGVLLYELLTGTTPLSHKRMKQASLLEVLRVIREEEPPRPSTRLGTTDELPAIAAVRGSEPARLSRLVRGELDWIVMKALEKDRNRRYESANGFAQDVERYLGDEPVHACPPSRWYRFRKFARHQKSALVMMALVLLALVSLAGGIGWVARDHSARQTVIRNGALQSLGEADAHQEHGRWNEALAAAERAQALLGTGTGNEGLRQRAAQRLAEARVVLGIEKARAASTEGYFDLDQENSGYERAFREYGIDVDALQPEEAAARIRASAVRRELTAILLSWSSVRERLRVNLPDKRGTLGWQRLLEIAAQADPDPWRTRLGQALARRDVKGLVELAAAEREILVQPVYTLDRLGDALLRSGATKEAEAFLRKAQRLHRDDFWITFNLAAALGPTSEERIRYCTAAISIRPRNLQARYTLASVLSAKGRHAEAAAELRDAVRLGDDEQNLRNQLAGALVASGRKDEAIAELREAIRLRDDLPHLHSHLASLLAAVGNKDEAITECRRVLQLKPDDPAASYQLVSALAAVGKKDEAIAECRRVLQLKPDDPVARTNLDFALLGLAPMGFVTLDLKVGQVLDLAGPTLSGETFDLRQLRGKVVLIDFWATWCGPCVEELPNVRAVFDQFRRDGFEVVGVSLDHSRAPLEGFVKQRAVPWPQIFFAGPKEQGWDNPLARKFRVNNIPAPILVDREGRVVQVGARGPVLGLAVGRLLGKEPPPPVAPRNDVRNEAQAPFAHGELQTAGSRRPAGFRPRQKALDEPVVLSTFSAATASDLVKDIQAANLQGGEDDAGPAQMSRRSARVASVRSARERKGE